MTEPITVIFLTYDNGDGVRSAYARRSLKSLIDKLNYETINWYIADDGSPQSHIDSLLDLFPDDEFWKENNKIDWHTIPNGTYGRNANEAWQIAMQHSALTLFVEDDWVLNRELDLYRYACLLMEDESVSMVRLGYLNLGMTGTVFGNNGALYWRLQRDCDPYVFTGHPSLRHKRYWDQYGRYPEGQSPGETELSYGYQFRNGIGGDIVFPVSNGEYGPFDHIGEVKATF